MSKAKKLFTTYGKYYNNVTYEYRGYQYDVTYGNGWNTFVTPAHLQHQYEQEKIDKIIADKDKHAPGFTADEAFDMLYDYWETGDESVFEKNTK